MSIAEALKEYIANQVRDALFLVERHYDIILKCLKLDYPKWNISSAQKKNILNVNSWWVYNEISKEFEEDIIFAHAEEVGYKRTKKNPYIQRKNELFNRDAEGKIAINTIEPSTILDYIKKERIWDDNI